MKIEINLNDGVLSWSSDGLDGKSALWLMADALTDIYRYFFQEELRPTYNPQPSRVCIEYKEDQLWIAFRPEPDLAGAKALTAAALVALSNRGVSEFIDPFEVMFGAIGAESNV